MVDGINTFNPDWISPPGDTISDLLEEKELSQLDLAKRSGLSEKHVSRLINGKASISVDTALCLERVIGGSVNFWLSREAQYRARLVEDSIYEDFKNWVPWLDQFPVKDLMSLGIIEKRRLIPSNKPKIVGEVLKFLGVASPDMWQSRQKSLLSVAFRRSLPDKARDGAIASWLRIGEREAETFDGGVYKKSVFIKKLEFIRELTVQRSNDFSPLMKSACAEAGVVLAFVPALKGAHVSGAARWINKHRPLIQLSLYGKLNDRFWFSFFHEAAHIILHDKEMVFLDDAIKNDENIEAEANTWASDFLIPKKYKSELSDLYTRESIKLFAEKIGIHPGIVVGRLQHEGVVPYRSGLNSLKTKFRFTKVSSL